MKLIFVSFLEKICSKATLYTDPASHKLFNDTYDKENWVMLNAVLLFSARVARIPNTSQVYPKFAKFCQDFSGKILIFEILREILQLFYKKSC